LRARSGVPFPLRLSTTVTDWHVLCKGAEE
jgi:hypothetical protein